MVWASAWAWMSRSRLPVSSQASVLAFILAPPCFLHSPAYRAEDRYTQECKFCANMGTRSQLLVPHARLSPSSTVSCLRRMPSSGVRLPSAPGRGGLPCVQTRGPSLLGQTAPFSHSLYHPAYFAYSQLDVATPQPAGRANQQAFC